MIKADKSKRTFFKKLAAIVGFVSASSYLRSLISAHTNSIQAINANNQIDVKKQKKTWQQKKWVAMTDSGKKQMLDEIIGSHNKHRA